MKVYKYYFSATLPPVKRCCDLMNKAFGRQLTIPLLGEDESARPGVYGGVVGVGSEAPEGNLGCSVVNAVRASIDNGTNANLTAAELGELQALILQEEETDVEWWWGP